MCKFRSLNPKVSAAMCEMTSRFKALVQKFLPSNLGKQMDKSWRRALHETLADLMYLLLPPRHPLISINYYYYYDNSR